jgi:hypothetical protein
MQVLFLGGVVVVPLSRKVTEYDGKLELWRCDNEALNRIAVIEAAKEELGKCYSYWGLIRVLRRFLGWIQNSSDPWKPPDKFVCSQYVSYSYRKGGIDLCKESDEFTTPGDIAKSSQLRFLGTLVDDGVVQT